MERARDRELENEAATKWKTSMSINKKAGKLRGDVYAIYTTVWEGLLEDSKFPVSTKNS